MILIQKRKKQLACPRQNKRTNQRPTTKQHVLFWRWNPHLHGGPLPEAATSLTCCKVWTTQGKTNLSIVLCCVDLVLRHECWVVCCSPVSDLLPLPATVYFFFMTVSWPEGEESKFAKNEQLFAQWGQTWLPVTIVAVFANNYYNVHWTLSGETTSVHEDELKPGSHK